MKLYESDLTARRIGPLRVIDANGVPVVDAFDGPGEKEISVNDGPFAAALGDVVDIGDGYAYYEATELDASVRGFVTIRLSGPCVEVTLREEVEEHPQGIPVGTVDADDLHVGPLLALDDGGDPVLGEDFAGAGEIEVSINGAAWTAPAGAVVELSDGYYDYVPDPTEVTAVGWLAVKIGGVCQEFVFRVDIVASSSGATVTIISPTPGVPPGQPGGFPANRDEAIRTPIVLRLVGVDGGLESVLVVVQFFGSQADLEADLNGVEMTVFRRGAFRGKHRKDSTAVMDGDDIILTIFHEGGWQGRFIKFDFDGAGGG